MIKITFVASDGERREVEIEEGETAREAALYNDVPGIDGDCGGVCACATCHVYVERNPEGAVSVMGEDEDVLLDGSTHRQSESRLSCQIRLTEAHNGLKVIIAPED